MPVSYKISFSEFIDLVLARLYELEQQQGTGFFSLNVIAKELRTGLKEPVLLQWIFDAGKVLESRDLAQCDFAFGGMCIAQLTGEGRLYVEQKQGTGIIEKYQKDPSNFIIVSGEGHQVIVGSNQRGITQTMNIEKEREPAFQLLDQIKRAIQQDNSLSDGEKEDLYADLEMVRIQLRKRKPNRPALAALLEPFSQIASIAGLVTNLIRLLNP